jgi:hypothetical protein
VRSREDDFVTEFSARCPKCDNRSFEPPETLDVAVDFACHVCGHHGKLVEFADLATLDAIVDEIKKRALETVRGANGNGAKAIG